MTWGLQFPLWEHLGITFVDMKVYMLFLIVLEMSVGYLAMFSFSFLILVICIFYFFCQTGHTFIHFIDLLQEPGVGFNDSIYIFSNFIVFCLYYFFLFLCSVVNLLFLSSSLKWKLTFLIGNFSLVLIYVFHAMNILLSKTFTVFHKFWYFNMLWFFKNSIQNTFQIPLWLLLLFMV